MITHYKCTSDNQLQSSITPPSPPPTPNRQNRVTQNKCNSRWVVEQVCSCLRRLVDSILNQLVWCRGSLSRTMIQVSTTITLSSLLSPLTNNYMNYTYMETSIMITIGLTRVSLDPICCLVQLMKLDSQPCLRNSLIIYLLGSWCLIVYCLVCGVPNMKHPLLLIRISEHI